MNRACIVWLLISAVVALITPEVIAESTQAPLVCGKASITVTQARFREGQPGEDFTATIQLDSQRKVIRFTNENDFLKLRCQSGKNGKLMLLVNHTCGGTGCAESNFGIIDLQTLDVLLVPDSRWKGNHAKAEALLGVEIKSFSCKHFDGLQANGDHCYNTRDY